jgi:hypothetical protein
MMTQIKNFIVINWKIWMYASKEGAYKSYMGIEAFKRRTNKSFIQHNHLHIFLCAIWVGTFNPICIM